MTVILKTLLAIAASLFGVQGLVSQSDHFFIRVGHVHPGRLLRLSPPPLPLLPPRQLLGADLVAVIESRGGLTQRPCHPNHGCPAGQALPLLVRSEGGYWQAGKVRQPLLRQSPVVPEEFELVAKLHRVVPPGQWRIRLYPK